MDWKKGKQRLWQEKEMMVTTSRNSFTSQKWVLAIMGFLLLSLMIINNVITNQFDNSHFVNVTIQNIIKEKVIKQAFILEIKNIPGFLIHTNGCRIAAFDPMDTVAKDYIKKEKPIICEFGTQLPLIESNETSVFINENAINQYYNSSDTINCCWRSFQRKKDNDNSVIYDEECHEFNESSIVTAEFVKVECFKEGKRIYRDYHFFVPRKASVEKRCEYIKKMKHIEANKKLNYIDSNDDADDDYVGKKRDELSVLILGIDSVSRMNFHRMMPKTVKALKSLGAIEMMGYNKVGDNTYPNLVPVLSGLSDIELHKSCWKNEKKPFDDCPFLWKNFSGLGYRTIFAEDACGMTTFNYIKPGFLKQPTDYYLRPYCIATESDIGNTHKLNADLCVGTRKTFANLLNYSVKIAKEFSSDKYFAFFWEASLTHDFFNYPQLGDDTYKNVLDYLNDEKLLNNTVLIMMSDHGMRWGDFRQTYQGRMEGSLPFVFIVFPNWWKKQYPLAWLNIQKNTANLVTPFDLHETLLDILNQSELNDDNIRKRMYKFQYTRGISWFLRIPENRSCLTAGIPGHWCMCHKSTNVSLNNPAVKNSTGFIINELNNMIKKYPECSPLKISSIHNAKMWSGQDGNNNFKTNPWTDYTITIETIPGNAIFEATVRYKNNNSSSSSCNNLVGTISRLNTYGNQSSCIDDFTMRLYCYCH